MLKGLCIGAGVGFANLLSAMPASAQTLADIPEGCTAFVSIQERGCRIRHMYRCDGAPDDMGRLLVDEDGAYGISTIDREAQWIRYESLRTNYQRMLMPGANDPMSLTDLFADGLDTFDFRMIREDGSVERQVGSDWLTGETAVIDGVELLVTEFVNARYDETGIFMSERRGTEFAHPEWRTYLGGQTEVRGGTERSFNDRRPVEFAFPGEPGFLSMTPLYDCGGPQTSKIASEE